MKLSISIYKLFAFFCLLCLSSIALKAADSSKVMSRKKADTLSSKMNMDAIYNRPFVTFNKLPLAIGGYLEANTEYASEDGVNNGFNFQMRRMTLFFSSTIAKKIKFFSELEFENGTKEINIETAVMDIEFHPMLNVRGGIVLNPIGAFNQNHDGPRWDFVDRPVSATEIIPSTLSNVGVGLHGKYFHSLWTLGYELYLTNGLNENLILNEDNRTSFHEAKEDADKFTQSHSGSPMFTGKIALRNRNIGEVGVSYLTGIYNQWQRDGIQFDSKRRAGIFAIDFNTSLFKNKLTVCGEIAKSFVQLPANYIQQYGSKQIGGYCDIIATVLHQKILEWDHAKLNIGCRLDYADFNQGTFRESQDRMYDETWAITPCIAFRPVGTTVIRFNYKFLRSTDLVGNPPAKTGILQFGIASYF